MSTTQNDPSALTGEPSDGQSDSINFSAPLASSKSGRLVFTSGAERLELNSDPSMPHLYQARFGRFVRFTPHIRVQANNVTIEYRRFPSYDRLANLRAPLTKISLNGSIPWEIEFCNSVSHLNADLRQLRLRSLDILNGASQIRLMLSPPSGTSYLYISGGISQGTLLVPPSANVKVQVSGGATNLAFVDQRFDMIDGEISLVSSGFDGAKGGYDICLSGGAIDLTISQH